MQLREEVEWFSFEMEKVLKDNDHKDGWDSLHLLALLTRLEEEVEELKEMVDYAIEFDSIEEFYREAVKKEAVDVANFAMFIAWKVRRQ